MRRLEDYKGFTVIELMIATAVFGVILLLASGATITLSRQFYMGTTKARTQEVARNVAEEVARNIQFSTSEPVKIPVSPAEAPAWCIADRRYTYVTGKMLEEETPKVLVRGDDCNSPTSSGDAELIGERMRLSKLVIENSSDKKVWRITAKVVYGSSDSLNDPHGLDASCKQGVEFCAVSEYSATVVRRL